MSIGTTSGTQDHFGRGLLGTVEKRSGSFRHLEGIRGLARFRAAEDHYAIPSAPKRNCIGQYAFCPVEFENDDFPFAARLLVWRRGQRVAAGKNRAPRRKIQRGSRARFDRWAEAFGVRRRGADRSATWRPRFWASSPDAGERLKASLKGRRSGATSPQAETRIGPDSSAEALLTRLEHSWSRAARLFPRQADAWLAAICGTFGRLADQSQHAAEQLLGNPNAKTAFLAAVRPAGLAPRPHRRLEAVLGGSVWALVQNVRKFDDFLALWADQYRERFRNGAETRPIFSPPAPARRHSECVRLARTCSAMIRPSLSTKREPEFMRDLDFSVVPHRSP